MYLVVTWPEVQLCMERPGWEDHSYLVNDDRGIADFGSSAYFVEVEWFKQQEEYFRQQNSK